MLFIIFLITYVFVVQSSQNFSQVIPLVVHPNGTRFSLSDYLKLQSETVNIEINLNGSLLILELNRNENLINLKSLIERKSRNYTSKNYFLNRNCFFNGQIQNSKNSFVIASLCERLNGFIYINGSIYIIEPFSDDKKNPTHKIYLTNYQIGSDFYFQNFVNPRSKKSISIERTVEALVVADSTMSKQYRYLDLENYLLTIMNMVSFIYRDPSLESFINIAVVKIIIFENEDPFEISSNASKTLENFCKYQNQINFPESHPNHHDLAILITRTDICGVENNCDTSGLANLGSMCDPLRSCNVNEDTGLSLAFTIAHEIGHNFNADHDTEENKCTNSTSPFLMNTHLTSLNKNLIWSECSRTRINKFLDQADLKCLEDEPTANILSYEFPTPGVFYSMDDQCKFSYGENAGVCKNYENQCNEVWCQIKGQSVCLSKGERPADGTLCGDGQNYWCMNKECVLIEEFKKPIDGDWGNWSEWSNCNRECNGGIQYIERKCNNPKPAYGGKYCLGERKRYRICNPQKCNDSLANVNFKNKQCERFNDVPFGAENLKYEWEFHNFNSENKCKLYCKPKNDFFYKVFSENLDDGTPCSESSNDVCINGICTPVGCDWMLGSNITYDSCGVCGGDDSSCNLYRGTVEATFPYKGGYQPLFVVPKNARSIRIYEYSNQKKESYLAVKSLNGTYYLNGQFSITLNSEFKINDVKFTYSMTEKKQSIISNGPLGEDILIMLLLLTNDVSVSYFYTLPNNYALPMNKYYTWEYINDWSSCSKSCGKGFKKNSPKCMEVREGIVDDSFCYNLIKPADLYEFCNLIECEPTWWIGDWQECSASCSSSGIGYKKRSVLCVKQKPNQINDKLELIPVLDKECNLQLKPYNIEECMIDLSNCSEPYWIVEEWNRNCLIDLCSTETRIVKCSDPNAICDPNKRPISERKCDLPPNIECGKWTFSQWSSCNKSCGEAYRTRQIECSGGTICNNLLKPHETELCFNNPVCVEDTNFDPENDSITADLVFSLKKNHPKSLNRRNIPENVTDDLADYFYTNDFNSINYFGENENGSNETEIDENSILSGKEYFIDDDLSSILVNDSLDYEWQVGLFSACSRKCGNGIKSRKVECISKKTNEKVNEIKCKDEKPDIIEKCVIQECDPWNYTNWSECLSVCGSGYQSRKVFCSHPNKLCDQDNVPAKKRPCISKPCYEWRTDEWSECSATCGQGFKIRRVYCYNHMTNSTSDYCDKKDIPKTVQNCSLIDVCPIENKFENCVDKFNKNVCRIISYSNRCNEPFLNSKCCKTCSKQKKQIKKVSVN